MSNVELVRVGGDPDRLVDALVAFIVIDPETKMEGIIAAGNSPERQLPLVFTAGSPAFDAGMMIARRIASEHGATIEVRRYECVSRESVT